MAVRITPPLDKTEAMLTDILTVIMSGDRAAFIVPSGAGELILARIRTMISRKRRRLKSMGKKVKYFTLQASIHPETHDGKRMDCIIVWRQVTVTHSMSEQLEDLLANG
jgi:hypothetical protein